MKRALEERVRAYDVDGRGVATVASMLHYAEDSRLALAMALHEEGVVYPLRNLARAQHLVVHAPLPVLARFTATSHVSRVGGTSFDVATLLSVNGEPHATVRITFVVVDAEGKKTSVPESMQRAVVRDSAAEGPFVPESLASPTFEHVYEVLPRDENAGRHVSHARIAEHVTDALRLGAAQLGEDAHAHVRAISLVYERETRFPDRLTVRAGRAAPGTFDVTLARAAGPLVARARIVTRA